MVVVGHSTDTGGSHRVGRKGLRGVCSLKPLQYRPVQMLSSGLILSCC